MGAGEWQSGTSDKDEGGGAAGGVVRRSILRHMAVSDDCTFGGAEYRGGASRLAGGDEWEFYTDTGVFQRAGLF